jgi:biopolymer transport protein ExbD
VARLTGLGEAAADDGPIATVNIIPFVDIVLVLLTVFMLTSSAIARASLSVELPRAASAGSRVQSTLNFVLTRAGALLVDGAPCATGEAAARIDRAVAANPKTQAVISADRGVEYGRVIELVDLVKQHGITAFALDVERGAAAGR